MGHEPRHSKKLPADEQPGIPRLIDLGTGKPPRMARSDNELQRIERFISALNQAMVVNALSQRRLATAIGVEPGTFTKYLRGNVDPWKVGSRIQALLARQLGVTLDALMAYYEGGAYLTGVNADQVESWIRSEAGQENLPELLQALQDAGQRWKCAGVDASAKPKPYRWPMQVIEESGFEKPILERLGISDAALNELLEDGVINEELVEGFSLILKAQPDEIRTAFKNREPLG